jgi:DNA-binding LytR/AlgR family response regulator
MRKYKILIVEDDVESLERLMSILKSYDKLVDLPLLVKATSFLEAQNIIASGKKFEISILDRNLDEGETCYSLITEKNREIFGLLVFNTIEKKDQEELSNHRILGRYLILGKPYTEKSVAKLFSEIAELQLNNDAEAKVLKPLLIKENLSYKVLPQGKIIYLEVKGNLTDFYYYNEAGLKSKVSETGQLSDYLQHLSSNIFQQINRSIVVNTSYIIKFSKKDKSLHLNGITEGFTISESFFEKIEQRYIRP